MRNIRSQFEYAIQCSFQKGKGASKHSDKINGTKNGKIYSYSSFHGRQDVSREFANFLKMEHKEIKMAYQIKQEHIEEFIYSKRDSCTTETLNTYRSNLNGLAENLNKTYGINVDFSCPKIVGCNGNKDIRTNPMKETDLKILQQSYKANTSGYNAVVLASVGGLRVSEIAKLQNRDIDIVSSEQAIIHIVDSKGKRNRDISITNKEDIKRLQELKSYRASEYDRFVNCNSKSLTENLNRHMKSTNIKDTYLKQGFHSIRKMWAQKQFDDYRQTHSKQQTLGFVSEQLGHSSARDMKTLQRYISNIY